MAGLDDFTDDELDELLKDSDSDSTLVRRLRKQLRDKGKALAEKEEALSTLRKEQRGGSLADLLKDADANPGLAKFFPSDKEPTKESVAEWLKEDGALFGWKPKEGDSQEQESNENVDAMQRVQDASHNRRGGSSSTDLAARIQNAKSPEELAKIYEEAGAQTSAAPEGFQ